MHWMLYLLPIVIIALAFGPWLVASQRRKRLLATGKSARGTILSVEQTGAEVNDQPEVKFKLRVEPEGEAPFETTAKQVILLTQIPQFQAGQTVTVRYDPQNREQAVIASLGFVSMTPEQANEMATKAQALMLRLNQGGKSAKAIVTKFTPTGVMVNGNNPLAVVDVKVMPDGGAPFDSVMKGVFAQTGLEKYQPGKEIKVVFDPADMSEVAVDRSWAKVTTA